MKQREIKKKKKIKKIKIREHFFKEQKIALHSKNIMQDNHRQALWLTINKFLALDFATLQRVTKRIKEFTKYQGRDDSRVKKKEIVAITRTVSRSRKNKIHHFFFPIKNGDWCISNAFSDAAYCNDFFFLKLQTHSLIKNLFITILK